MPNDGLQRLQHALGRLHDRIAPLIGGVGQQIANLPAEIQLLAIGFGIVVAQILHHDAAPLPAAGIALVQQALENSVQLQKTL